MTQAPEPARPDAGNAEILRSITELVEEERALRNRSGAQGPQALSAEERDRLKGLEVRLDQCWDLLRQRRAEAEFGRDPDDASVRPPGQVENYRQ
ncbi:DUF2630 family protein [Allonocardiopsis opalescens]|uniref:Uncharacterized protein DUF2630 n=1 Tax=Allonocardiopsis opalescens TaxID=1144618 RepID=A0A2T0QAG9_9ACTN|nr:DUF2630 family protein [Allonocardiopsis opalescens]PRY00801.1 uncharacterized protein DUF2630 [Allonocardiopsis opalescens]